MDITTITQSLTQIQPEYWYGAIFLGTFFLGESVIISAFIFATLQPASMPLVILATLFGTITADLFWYFVATHILSKTRLKNLLQKKPSQDMSSLLSIADRNPYIVLLFIKFFTGIRIILTITLISRVNLSFKKYLLFDSIGALIFIIILGSISSLSGESITSATSPYKILTTILFTIIGFSIVFHIASRMILKHLTSSPK